MQLSTKLGNFEVVLMSSVADTTITLPKQTHGNTIIPASACEHGVTEADGIIGTLQDSPFGIHTADCLPLVVTTQTRAATIHISRHTLVAGILDELTRVIAQEKIIAAYIGPHICQRCFTFTEKGEGILQFEKHFPSAVQEKNSCTHISLQKVIHDYLTSIGVPKNAIEEDGRCTFETPKLASYKRWITRGKQGDFPRMTTVVRRLI